MPFLIIEDGTHEASDEKGWLRTMAAALFCLSYGYPISSPHDRRHNMPDGITKPLINNGNCPLQSTSRQAYWWDEHPLCIA